jgi:ATP-dependent Lon protease
MVGERRVLLVPCPDGAYAKVGVVAEAESLPKNGRGNVVLMPLHRGVPSVSHADADGVLRVDVDEKPDVTPPPAMTRDLEREYRAVVEEILQLRGDDGRISAFVRSIADPGMLADTAGYSPDLNHRQKIELLETLDVVERLSMALKLQQERLAELRVRKRIREDVESGAQKQQREYFLRKQMDAIKKELGESDASVAEDYRKKIADAGMPESVQQQAEREIGRFERMGESNAVAAMIRTYLDWLLARPWWPMTAAPCTWQPPWAPAASASTGRWIPSGPPPSRPGALFSTGRWNAALVTPRSALWATTTA